MYRCHIDEVEADRLPYLRELVALRLIEQEEEAAAMETNDGSI